MFRGFGRSVTRSFYRRTARRRKGTHQRASNGVWLTVLTAIAAAAVITGMVMLRLRPLVAEAAQSQVENSLSRLVEAASLAALCEREVGYGDFVAIERGTAGAITALSTDMAAMNQLRGAVLERILDELGGISVSNVRIPVGSLLGLDVFWGRGPEVSVCSMSAGTVSAEFESEFADAGVNQTQHRIWLAVCVPVKLFLPGEVLKTEVKTRLCVAETVIVGTVPDTYLNLKP